MLYHDIANAVLDMNGEKAVPLFYDLIGEKLGPDFLRSVKDLVHIQECAGRNTCVTGWRNEHLIAIRKGKATVSGHLDELMKRLEA